MAIVGAAAIGAVATVGSAEMSSSASKSAAKTQADAAAAANAQQTTERKPWVDAGTGALNTLSTGLQPGGQYAKPFTMADATNSEAEQFALKEGTQAIQNSAAAKGGLVNTNSVQDLTKFAEGNASQFENQAFNQWLQSRQQSLNANQSLAGLGMQQASNTADASSSLMLSGANATAAGQVGSANAVSGAVGSVGQQMSTLSNLFKNNSSVNPYTTAGSDGSYQNPTYGSGGQGIDMSANVDSNTGAAINSSGDYSDERLKEGMKKVGKTEGGLPIYTYRMKGGGPVKMGVLAQDVEKVAPTLVSHDRHGMKMVDYAGVR